MIAYTDDITSTRLPASRVLSEVAALHLRVPMNAGGKKNAEARKKRPQHGRRGRDLIDTGAGRHDDTAGSTEHDDDFSRFFSSQGARR